MNNNKILEKLSELGAPTTEPQHLRVWLKAGPNFIKARKAALRIYKVGPHAWRYFLSHYNLEEEMLPVDQK